MTILNLTEDVQQYSIAQGTATFRISHMDDDDVFEIDTPNAAISLEATGLYRVYVDADGDTRISVRRGEARVSSGGGEVALRTGEAMHIDGVDEPRYDVFALPLADSWDRWVDSRERRRHSIVSYDYASEDVLGVSDLDSYGRWEETPEFGHVWFPANVAADWTPYRVGHWMWQDPWGWTWVSSEPWGWAPYHYGRWALRASRWCWVPVARNVRHVAYAPALVGFVGGGPGWSASISLGGGGFVGWFPAGTSRSPRAVVGESGACQRLERHVRESCVRDGRRSRRVRECPARPGGRRAGRRRPQAGCLAAGGARPVARSSYRRVDPRTGRANRGTAGPAGR